MSGRARRMFYSFVSNTFGEYYYTEYSSLGEPVINKSASPRPLRYNPSGILQMKAEFATNTRYFSLHRAITYPFLFVKDGAEILRYLDYTKNGYETVAFYTLVKYNTETGIYELYYIGKFDFTKKKDDPIAGYTINTVDNTVWGILSQRDDVKVQIPCNPSNPKAIKVLFDGVTLKAKYIYQPVATPMDLTSFGGYLVFPIAQVATDGDSFGIISQGQDYYLTGPSDNPTAFMAAHPAVFAFQTSYATTIDIEGEITMDVTSFNDVGFSLAFYWWRSTDTATDPIFLPADRLLGARFSAPGGLHLIHRAYTVPVNATFDLAEGERIMLTCLVADFRGAFGDLCRPSVTPVITNFTINTTTKIIPSVAYALRPLDLVEQIVQRATGGLFTINSEYYSTNNKVVVTCGEALRGEPLAHIETSFQDWFKSYDAGDFLAMRMIGGQLWIEKADEVYKQDSEILDIGEVSDIIIEQDLEHLANMIEVGSPAQDYRHSSGRLEFNNVKRFSTPITMIKNMISLVSQYRRDCYGIEFLRLDYQGGNSTDNSGDRQNFMVDITDELGEATTFIENFKVYQIDNAPLAPVITSPHNNDIINYPSPRIRGNAPPGSVVNIYVDTVFDGSTVADSSYYWDYNIVAVLTPYQIAGTTIVETGTHVVDATFTDETGDLATVTFTVVSDTALVSVIYPADQTFIVDNKPLFRGTAQRGELVTLMLDGIIPLAIVSADNSCNWEYQSPVISNDVHSIRASIGSGESALSAFSVDTHTAVPIILHPTDEFILVDNTPLVEGVATPGTVVFLYVDYYEEVPVGMTVADTSGNWSYQLSLIYKLDGLTIQVPIPNGQHTISTGMTIQNTPIQSAGYKLHRPAYDEITGVLDNTVFNVELSPKRMLMARSSYWASIMVQNKLKKFNFAGGDKNQSLSTLLDGVLIKENADVSVSAFGLNMFLPIRASFKTVVPKTFNSIFNFFNSGGTIRALFQGNELWFLPIGNMSIEDVSNDVQTWRLLFSRLTPLTTILNLYRSGLNIEVMTNAIHHSDYNSLHFVKYDYTIPAKYHAKEIYDDWFEERNERWYSRPLYVQKFQTTEVIRDQIISNGVSDATLVMYNCDAVQIALFPYNPVTPTPIPPPDVVQEAEIDLSLYDEGRYFFVITAGGNPVAISECIHIKADWPETILIEANNSTNLTGFMYSTGIISKLRIEGLVTKWQPDILHTVNRDEVGDNQSLHNVMARKRNILIGKASGLPDYLYLKTAAIVILDHLIIEGIEYVATKENRLEPVDKVLGHPMYHYQLEVELARNNQGNVFATDVTHDIISVVITVDAEAFGVGGSQLVDIEIKSE